MCVKLVINKRNEIFTSPKYPEVLWSPTSHLFSGFGGVVSMGIKWLCSVVDHSPPSIAEVIYKWDIFLVNTVKCGKFYCQLFHDKLRATL